MPVILGYVPPPYVGGYDRIRVLRRAARHIRPNQLNVAPMFFSPGFDRSVRLNKNAGWSALLVLWLLPVFPFTSLALPQRLVLGLDGVAYRDVQALQNGIVCTNIWGRPFRRQAFGSAEGYFPASRMVSTFPSTSDVAWTDIFGDRPLPGYQRTYFSAAANSQIPGSSLTISMEHERQMHWQAESAYLRAMAYVYPLHTFKSELRQMTRAFLESRDDGGNYYVYVRST